MKAVSLPALLVLRPLPLLVTSDPTLGSAFDWENYFWDFSEETYRISSYKKNRYMLKIYPYIPIYFQSGSIRRRRRSQLIACDAHQSPSKPIKVHQSSLKPTKAQQSPSKPTKPIKAHQSPPKSTKAHQSPSKQLDTNVEMLLAKGHTNLYKIFRKQWKSCHL